MSTEKIIESVRVALRLKNNVFDDMEIVPLIDAAKRDMLRVGILYQATDPLCVRAVILYCKANFGYSSDGEKFNLAYESLRDSMSLSGMYHQRQGENNVQ
ncbi:MAG: DNA-packaging protein [Clostridiales bacterium]